MKKIILTATMALCTVALFAQNAPGGNTNSGLMSKKGEMILPESGDWAISFDASPFLTYLGSFFTSSSGLNPAPTANFLNNNNTIVGKYFVDDQTAYRGILRIGFTSTSMTHLTQQDVTTASNPPTPTVNDKLSLSSHFIGLGAGMEKRKGKTRLQGYYGAELMFWIATSGNDSTMTYGNAFDNTNFPTGSWSHNWATGADGQVLLRQTAGSQGSIFGISIQGFIGFDYFFLPKISVGAEYTWGINFWSQGQGSDTYEGLYTLIGATGPTDNTYTTKSGSSSKFGVDTGINSQFGNTNAGSAALNITFHF